MTTRRAECSCGQLTATCAGEPGRVSVCHCLACKRRSGSAFGYGAWWADKDVTIAGRTAHFVRIGDEGCRIEHSFCPDCGVTIAWKNDRLPGVIAIAAGTFADLSFPPPTVSVYDESRRYSWVDLRTDPLVRRG